jgi:hypothetical protein
MKKHNPKLKEFLFSLKQTATRIDNYANLLFSVKGGAAVRLLKIREEIKDLEKEIQKYER